MEKLLVVIDMQNDFISGCLGTREAQNILPKIADYIRTFDGEVVFTKDTHDEDYLDTQEGIKLPVPHCIKGTEGWEIAPELEMKDVKIFEKNTFGSLQLAHYIVTEGFEEVEFCGVCTGICVISNVILTKTYCPETKIKVLKDLCACISPVTHENAIEAMRVCQVEII